MTTPRIPKPTAASYRAAAYIHTSGPQTTEELFAAVNCGIKPSNRKLMIESALSTGWLVEVAGKIDLSETARAHFDDAPFKPKAKPTGSVATSREPLVTVYERPPLSRKYMPSSRGNRDDVPAYSVRENMRFSTLAGGV